MSIRVFRDAQALAQQSASVIRAYIEKKPDAIFCFAAGSTQIPTYNILTQWVKQKTLDLSRLRVIGLDEIAGASRADREGFRYFLDTHLFRAGGVADAQVTFIDPRAQDMQAQCQAMDEWLDGNGPIDFLLLGIGGNGHIGYNEPGSDVNARTHMVDLEKESVAAGQTYFDHAFPAERGITLGLYDLLRARTILVQATGDKKRRAYDLLQQGVARADAPVTHLLGRGVDVDFFFDAAAAGSMP